VLVVVLGGGIVGTAMRASADVTLPARTAAQLLVDLQTAQLDGASGTVVEQANLGLPAIPDGFGGGGTANLNSMITGSHTLRVWYSGPDKARVALLGALGESDVIQNGSDAWIWSSSTNSATHYTIKAGAKGATPVPSASDLPTSPQQAADRALAAIDPTTKVSTESGDTVAGRAAYVLSLTPKDTASLISKVSIAVDGSRHIPLRVQVFAKGADKPAFEVGFQTVSFTRPDNAVFAFTPPAGAKVSEAKGDPRGTSDSSTGAKNAVIGKGWTAVLALRESPTASAPGSTDSAKATGSQLDQVLSSLPRVSGSWGSGRLLQSTLFSALITDDGRVLVGAVSGQRLLAAAADPAAALK
jgi:outer membrane lipoprotein-sorting protein